MSSPNITPQNHEDSEPAVEWADIIHMWIFRGKLLLKRFWWIFLVTISIGVGFQAYEVMVAPPMYVSSAQMIVSGRMALPEGAIYSEELSNFFGTQISLMQSHRVKERARARVKAMDPSLVPCMVGVSVSQSPDASIFMLNAHGSNPDYVQAYLDAMMQEYLNFKREMRSQTADRTFLAITEEVVEIQKKIEEGEDEKLDFQKDNNIVFIQEQGSSVGAYLADLNQELAEYETQYHFLNTLSLEALSGESEPTGGTNDADGAHIALKSELFKLSKQYSAAKQELTTLYSERDEYATYMKEKHPKLSDINLKIDREENELKVLYRQAMRELDSKKATLEARIDHLKDVIALQEVKALDYSRRLAEFERINSRLDRQKAILENLMSSIQSIDLNLNLDQELVSVLENATPSYRVELNAWKKLAMGAFVGIVMGVGILALISILDSRLISVDDVESRFELPLLGIIPYQKVEGEFLDPLKPDDERVMFAEACRNLRSSVLFGGDESANNQVIAITSSVPGEGKSTVAVNLATTFAFAGKKTILFDADLRRGILHKSLGLENERGVSDVVRERASFEDAIQNTAVTNLDFVSRGTPTRRPGELISSAVFEHLLDDLRSRYDYVLLDLPPVLATDDTPGFVQKVDAVLFIVRSNLTRVKQAKSAMHILMFRRANILGIVLNAFDVRGPGYYYHRYGEYYARGEGHPSSSADEKV